MRRSAFVSLAALAVISVPASAEAATLERQPYLQSAGETSMTIVWTTLASSTGEVRWGSTPGALSNSVPSAAAGTQHEVVISGLTAGTKYYYEVWGDGAPLAGNDAAHFFVTSPPVGSPEKFRAWVVGDSGTGGGAQAQVRDAMLAYAGGYRPDLYLHVGDMAYTTGTYNQFTTNFYAPYAGILRNTPIWPAMGNHEGASSQSATQTGPYYDGYVLPTAGESGGLGSGTEAYYSFDYANVHFIVLDSHDSDRTKTGPMLTWAAADAADATSRMQEWIIAYWHHPPYTKGSHDSDTEGRLIDMRENALEVLELEEEIR